MKNRELLNFVEDNIQQLQVTKSKTVNGRNGFSDVAAADSYRRHRLAAFEDMHRFILNQGLKPNAEL